MANPGLPILLDLASVNEVLTRYEAGEQISQISRSYGTSDVTVYKRVIAHAEEKWKEIQVARALARKEQAEEELDSATDMISLARGRERLKSAQWDLERVCRRIYGTDSPPAQGQGSININISVGPGSQTPPTIDVTPSPAPQQDDTHQD